MLCTAGRHYERVSTPQLAKKIMRVDSPCGCLSHTVALCVTCHTVDEAKIETNHQVRCRTCGRQYGLREAWKMIGDA